MNGMLLKGGGGEQWLKIAKTKGGNTQGRIKDMEISALPLARMSFLSNQDQKK